MAATPGHSGAGFPERAGRQDLPTIVAGPSIWPPGRSTRGPPASHGTAGGGPAIDATGGRESAPARTTRAHGSALPPPHGHGDLPVHRYRGLHPPVGAAPPGHAGGPGGARRPDRVPR